MAYIFYIRIGNSCKLLLTRCHARSDRFVKFLGSFPEQNIFFLKYINTMVNFELTDRIRKAYRHVLDSGIDLDSETKAKFEKFTTLRSIRVLTLEDLKVRISS